MVPVAMMLLVAGLMLGLAGSVGPRLVHEAVGSDFERGLMVGVGIGLEIAAVVLAASAASCAARNKKESETRDRGPGATD